MYLYAFRDHTWLYKMEIMCMCTCIYVYIKCMWQQLMKEEVMNLGKIRRVYRKVFEEGREGGNNIIISKSQNNQK